MLLIYHALNKLIAYFINASNARGPKEGKRCSGTDTKMSPVKFSQ